MKHLIIAFGGILSLSAVVQRSRPSLPESHSLGVVPVESMLVRKEKALWDANRNRDARALSELLADDTYAVETDGSVSDKRQQLADLPNLAISEVRMDGIRVLLLDPSAGIVRYRVLVTGAYKNKPMTSAWSEVSAVWALRGGHWRSVAYHATRIAK